MELFKKDNTKDELAAEWLAKKGELMKKLRSDAPSPNLDEHYKIYKIVKKVKKADRDKSPTSVAVYKMYNIMEKANIIDKDKRMEAIAVFYGYELIKRIKKDTGCTIAYNERDIITVEEYAESLHTRYTHGRLSERDAEEYANMLAGYIGNLIKIHKGGEWYKELNCNFEFNHIQKIDHSSGFCIYGTCKGRIINTGVQCDMCNLMKYYCGIKYQDELKPKPLNETYPWMVCVYKGEKRIAAVPKIRHFNGEGMMIEDHEWFLTLDENAPDAEIGAAVLSAFERIKSGVISKATIKDRRENPFWKNFSKQKGFISFWKSNFLARVYLYENGEYKIYAAERNPEEKGSFHGSVQTVTLPNPSAEEIGRAVCDCFIASEQTFKSLKNKPAAPQRGTIELLPETAPYKTISYEIPQDVLFTDAQDYHAAEIYQGYTYDDGIADFYFGMGNEENCDLTPENIRLSWERHTEKADFFEAAEVEHPIFTLRAEMRNKKIHKIAYYKEFAENDIFTCEMVVNQPNKRKKTDEKLTGLFGRFVAECRPE
jgi:hypothetical protein